MEPSPEQKRFLDFASRDFSFLVDEFGFTVTTDAVCGAGFAFANVPLALIINLGWYKAEVDFEFQLLLVNSVFRPYISRRFNLGEIVLHMDPNAFDRRFALPDLALSADAAHCFLRHYAMLIRKYCIPILNGDFAALEEITWERRRQQGQTEEERFGKFGEGKFKSK